ncbi:hypothetical protein LSH36_2233g00000 [Paralvinella palmiformis]|uniref:Uncharacterized protein n=1 Tax=Paralvinella palmiformis TaxID=53620 RepID=A0AAD9IQR5_9ANNE|nr:hypothetical protein LSH36_2233g00000 [Paralvinella palmiformis]
MINSIYRSISSIVDNACGADEIAQLFVSKHEQLYTSVPTDTKELGVILSNINKRLGNRNIDGIHVSVDGIANSISRLKSGKSDGGQGFDADHLLNSTSKLVQI